MSFRDSTEGGAASALVVVPEYYRKPGNLRRASRNNRKEPRTRRNYNAVRYCPLKRGSGGAQVGTGVELFEGSCLRFRGAQVFGREGAVVSENASSWGPVRRARWRLA